MRAADAAADAGAVEVWRKGPQLFRLDLVLLRIEQLCQKGHVTHEHYPDGLLRVFACIIDDLHEQRVVKLVFHRALATKGKLPSALGCHELQIIEPYEFLNRLREWVFEARRRAAQVGAHHHALEGDASEAVLGLLHLLGLRPLTVAKETRHQDKGPDGCCDCPSCSQLRIMHPADQRVWQGEKLWHRGYYAI